MLKNKAWREQPLRGDAIEAMKKAAGIARCGLSRKLFAQWWTGRLDPMRNCVLGLVEKWPTRAGPPSSNPVDPAPCTCS